MHKNADLDALASAFYLKEYFGEADIAADGLDRIAKSFVRKFNIEILSEIDEEKYDEILTVDTASFEQLGKFSNVKVDVVYDHHESNNMDAKMRFVDSSYPSCAEYLYDLLNYKPSKEASILLLGGIIMDTQWFRHARRDTFRIFHEILLLHDLEMNDISNVLEDNITFGEKISVLKSFQRMKYRTVEDKIICGTYVSSNESICATSLLQFCDIVFVASQREKNVRVTARSKDHNLLYIFEELSKDFQCSFGGHKKAAGANCMGDKEAIINALLAISSQLLKG